MCPQYMDRIYVKHQNKAPVSQLGLDLWRDNVVRQKGIRDRMLTMLLELIQKERAGDIIDRALLRSITMVRLTYLKLLQLLQLRRDLSQGKHTSGTRGGGKWLVLLTAQLTYVTSLSVSDLASAAC